MHPQSKRGPFLAIIALAAVLLLPATASAGSVTVSGTCGLWAPYNYAPGQIGVGAGCPTIVAANLLGGFATTTTAPGGWTLTAPAGTTIFSLRLDGGMAGLHGWQAAIYSANGTTYEGCPGATCPGGSKVLRLGGALYPGDGPSVTLRVRCGSVGGCPNSAINGQITVNNSMVTLVDATQPGLAITGGPLSTSNWQHGVSSVSYNAADGTGIKSVQAFLDGDVRADLPRTCAYVSTLVPCPNGGGTISINTTGVPDGQHSLTLRATDAAGNRQQVSMPVYIDNSAPGSPIGATLSGGDSWRSANSFALQWSNPPQRGSRIAAAMYTLCPAANPPNDSRGCVSGSRSGTGINALAAVAVPRPGAWTLSLFLRDGAGNADPTTAVVVPGLRFDASPPDVQLLPMHAGDPTRINVAARDAVSGIASEAIEIQRQRTNDWQEVPTTPTADGFTASLDDGALARGTYLVRARVIDRAGNERTVDSFPSGATAALALPVRIKTSLGVGKVKRVRAGTSRGGKPRYRTILVNRPWSRYGHTVSLHGRLTTPGGNPLAGATVTVSQRVDLPGSAWHPIAEVTTSPKGRFVFKALRGPSRLLRFRYAGTATVRSHVTVVDLRVHAATTIHVDHHHVANGDTVVFSGRLKTRPIPPGGKLVELQVYTRGLWRIFAQPRTSSSGRWSFPYRFQAVTGKVRFRFRARIRKEATYPFDLGISRRVRVTVQGA